jgi:hypothetical protein
MEFLMTVILTPDLVKVLAAAKGETVHLKDPTTNQEYVLLRAEVYHRISQLLANDEDGLSTLQVGILIEDAMREDDANDPLLATYQNYQSNQ